MKVVQMFIVLYCHLFVVLSQCVSHISLDSPSLISFDCDDAVAKRARTRVRVIAELIDTERKHVTDLNVGYNKIQIPLKNLEVMH